ncbi:MAG: SDR family oxidoreductase [Pseudomonadota bacterium]
MDLKLSGKKIIIAGASRGIGLAVAKAFAAEGSDVAICARGEDTLQSALKEISDGDARVIGHSVDIADADAYTAWVKQAAEELGGCDVFIPMASAGGGPANEASWKAAYEVDLMSVFRGVDAVTPYLENASAGAIVCVATTAALEEFAGVQAYNAMKAAVIAHASALAQGFAPKGVRVNTVSPGPVYIEGGSWNFVKDNIKPFYDATLASIPMGRFGTAEEVANAILFAASEAVPFMTGANIVVDGGITKRIQY